MENKQTAVLYSAWGLSALVAFLAFFAWGSSRMWTFTNLSPYEIFPLFGTLAFSLMWSHYMVIIIKILTRVKLKPLKSYFKLTSYVVLAAILLHPGLLIWQLFRDGLGLPPGSVVKNYVAPGMGWLVYLGMVSLVVFLAYEFHRKFDDRSWWKYVKGAGDLAMVAVFYHGLRLGSDLQGGWYQKVWLFYGLTLIGGLLFIYSRRLFPNKPTLPSRV